MVPQYQQIYLADIDLSDTSYTLNPFPAPEADPKLQADISSYGILLPPLLLEQKKRKFLILSGAKCIQAIQKDKDTTIPALVLDPTCLDQPEYVFGALLRHQLIDSGLSIIEQAIFFSKVQEILPEKNILQFLHLLGYKQKKHIPAELISLLTLHTTSQRRLHQGTLSLRAAKKLLLFPPDDQQKLTELIHELQLGGSKQQKLLDAVFVLSKRLHISGVEMLNRWQEKELNKQHNGPQRGAALLKWLQYQCNPDSTKAEEEFAGFCRQLQLPAGVRLAHTLSFEDEQVTLQIPFRSKNELTAKWTQIKSILQQP